jgi:KDO2-lipid IV(A) lauroyltransferase
MSLLVKFLANLAYKLDKRRKKVVFTNLDLVYPDMSKEEKEKLAKKIYENFVQNVFDIIKNRNISKEELKKRVEFEGLEKVEKYLDKPAIFITAHYGNWELLPLIVSELLNIPMTIVVRKIDNKFLDRFLRQNRERYNIQVIDKKGAMKGMIKAIKEGRSIGLLVDQNTAKNEGVDVKMFGLKALQTPSAALLSKKFDIPVIPGFIQRNGDKYKIIFKEPILEKDIQKSVQKQSDAIEEIIREKPEEWYWFHRRFKHYYEEKYE